MINTLFLILFLLHSPLISSISPPQFPETFLTEYKYVFQNETTTNQYYGIIAEDDMNKLTLIIEKYPSGFKGALFNQAMYYITGDEDGNITECVCFKNSFVPYFSAFRKFKLYSQTEDEIIWQVIGLKSSPDLRIFFRVKKVTPNIPEENIIFINVQGYSASGNMTYLAFQASNPGDRLFIIPEFCITVPCKSPYLKKDKFPFPSDWNN